MGSQILSPEGHDVVTVSDGDEAMQYLGENRPDLVMVDTRMPGPSGFEICKHIKNNPRLGSVKVVLLAGPLEPFDTSEAQSAGPDGVLHKPLDAYTLIETVNSLLGKVAETPDGDEAKLSAAAGPDESWAGALEQAISSAEASHPEPPAAEPVRGVGTATAVASNSSDPFASVVEQALGTRREQSRQREKVEKAVRRVVEAATPAIIAKITEQVMKSLDGE
jgi:CheY-like chemotaxis protein